MGLFAQAQVIVRAAIKSSAFDDGSGLAQSIVQGTPTFSFKVNGKNISVASYAAAVFGGRVTGNARKSVSARAASSARNGRAYHAHLVEGMGIRAAFRSGTDKGCRFNSISSGPSVYCACGRIKL